MEQLWQIGNKDFVNQRTRRIVSIHLKLIHGGFKLFSTILLAASGTHCHTSLVSHFRFVRF